MSDNRIEMMVNQLKLAQDVQFYFEVAPLEELVELVGKHEKKTKKTIAEEVFMMLYDRLHEITKQSNGESAAEKAEIDKLLENRQEWMIDAVKKVERLLENSGQASTSNPERRQDARQDPKRRQKDTGLDRLHDEEEKNKKDDFIETTRTLIDQINKAKMRKLISRRVDVEIEEIERKKEQAAKASPQHMSEETKELMRRLMRAEVERKKQRVIEAERRARQSQE